jgi:hypothetical protein
VSLYYFDLYDGDRAVSDKFGVDLDGIEEAADQAAMLLPDIARDALPGEGARDFATFVRDQDGTVVHRAALLYRAQSLSRDGQFVPYREGAFDIVAQSRATRDRARQLSARLDANISDLLDLIQQAARTIEDAKAASADRISLHMR